MSITFFIDLAGSAEGCHACSRCDPLLLNGLAKCFAVFQGLAIPFLIILASSASYTKARMQEGRKERWESLAVTTHVSSC